jgi:hypothetical protein
MTLYYSRDRWFIQIIIITVKLHIAITKMCPLVKIEIFEGNSKEYKKALIDAVRDSLV